MGRSVFVLDSGALDNTTRRPEGVQMISNLLHDFAEVLNVMPREHPGFQHLKLLDDAIRRDAGFVESVLVVRLSRSRRR